MRDKWIIEVTIGLIFVFDGALLILLIVGVLGMSLHAGTQSEPQQDIVQRVERTGDVKHLCVEAKTDGRIDAMSCQLIDTHTGGVK